MDVYKRTWKNSKGEMTTSNTYYFKTTINDKRKEVNTKKSNIKEAKIEMNKLIRNSGICGFLQLP